MLGRPASEKRQGTKSREVGAPSVPPPRWGFGRGVRLDEAGVRYQEAARLELNQLGFATHEPAGEFAPASPLEGTRFEPAVPSGLAFRVNGKFKFGGGLACHI
jgi:hypothetical protein